VLSMSSSLQQPGTALFPKDTCTSLRWHCSGRLYFDALTWPTGVCFSARQGPPCSRWNSPAASGAAQPSAAPEGTEGNVGTPSTQALLPLKQAQEQGWGQQVPAPVTTPSPHSSAFPMLSSVTQRGFGAGEPLNQTGTNPKMTGRQSQPYPLGAAKTWLLVSWPLSVATLWAPCSDAYTEAWRKIKHRFSTACSRFY